LYSAKHCSHPVHFLVYQKNKDSAIKMAVDEIIQKYGAETNIMFLGRTRYELNSLLESNLFSRGENKGELIYKENPSVPMSFMTVHKSKGLEAENVIILNFNNALLGFPNKIYDDPILELVLSTADTFL
jgi:DNA helicase-4